MIVKLPCGLFHEGKVFDRVVIHELTGKQQNYLANMELTSDNFGHVPKLIEDLATDYQTKEGDPAKDITSSEAVWKLPTEDIQVILVKIREATFGAAYALPAVCPNCGKKDFFKVNLDKLEIKSLKKKDNRTSTITLPKSKKKVEVKLLYLQDLFDLYKALKENADTLFTSTVVFSVQSIDDKSPVEPKDIEDIPLSDMHKIEDAALKLRGEIDLMITNECTGCKEEFESPLPVMDPLFFVPSQTPSTSSPQNTRTIVPTF